MTPQEKDLITTLLERLKGVEGQQKDAEAETLIRQAITEQPDAPYYLVQTVLIQDISLHNAQNRIADLEKRAADAQQRPAGSFLGGLFGRSQPAPAPASGSVPSAGPWGQSAPPQQPSAPAGFAQPGYGQPGSGQPPVGSVFGGGAGGGGFLRQAATTAAGVAGGALLFEGIQSLFGRGYGGMGGLGGGFLGGGYTPGLGETVINNYYGGDQGGDAGADYASSGFDPGTGQDYDTDQGSGSDFDPGQDDGGSDFGGGDFGGGDSTC